MPGKNRQDCQVEIIVMDADESRLNPVGFQSIVNTLQDQPGVKGVHVAADRGNDSENTVISRLKQTIIDGEQQITALENEVERLNQDLFLLQSSTSWRLTAPVRKLMTLVWKVCGLFRYRTHWMKPNPGPQLVPVEDDKYEIKGNTPQMALSSSRLNMPSGWVIISAKMVMDSSLCLVLNSADGSGFSKCHAHLLITDDQGRIHQAIRLPDDVRQLRLDILAHEGWLKIEHFRVVELGACYLLARQLWAGISTGIRHPGQFVGQVRKGVGYYRSSGAFGTLKRMLQRQGDSDYNKWAGAYSTLTPDDRKQIAAHIQTLTNKPLISILLPVYNTPGQMLTAAIESVLDQIYTHWELCIADDASTRPYIRDILEAYQKKDDRIKLVFRQENGHISACSNSALALATGSFTALMDHDDTLAPHALYMVVETLNRFPDADILYSDEDKIDIQGQRFSPHFKPDWNPELFFSINYLSHFGVYRTSLLRSVNGFRQGMEGSQDYDLVLRCLPHTHAKKICHIPHVLYHWRATRGSTALSSKEKNYATHAGIRALSDYFTQIDPDIRVSASDIPTTYRVKYPVKNEPAVCIVIPTKNNYRMLKRCVDSIFEKTKYDNFSLVVVNNQSDHPDTLAYLNSLNKTPRCRVLAYDHPFNYSAINNFAVSRTAGEMVCLLNDDIEVISRNWLREMVSHALQPDVGAVGAKLLYPDHRIQHAGVILGIGGVAGHSHKYTDTIHAGYGYFCRLLLPQMMSAVTAACLLVRRQVYEDAGGLDEKNLQIAFNDVDFCLRIRQAGFRNVWTPHARLYHHESVSRGHEDTRAKQLRFKQEIDYMKKTWGNLLKNDPCYNPNLTDITEDFALGFPSRAEKPWQKVYRGKFYMKAVSRQPSVLS